MTSFFLERFAILVTVDFFVFENWFYFIIYSVGLGLSRTFRAVYNAIEGTVSRWDK